jgi:hypothetical protein
MNRDIFNRIKVVTLFAPKAAIGDDTAFVSSIVDTNGYESCALVVVTGNNADADAVMSLKVRAPGSRRPTTSATTTSRSRSGTRAASATCA